MKASEERERLLLKLQSTGRLIKVINLKLREVLPVYKVR
jgi:hypothetical protein